MMEFKSPIWHGGELNTVERQKLQRHPFEVYTAILETYSKKGIEAVLAVEGEMERLKWVGIYPQKQGGNNLMLRIKIPGGQLNSTQARKIAKLAGLYGKASEDHPYFGNSYCDITTRQDIQLHWIKIESIPEIWGELESVGLTTLQACGDDTRNVVGCPVSGLDPHEAFDATPDLKKLSDYFHWNKEFSNLPRKFKISISGCTENCAQANINDIGLLPAIGENGVLGYHVLAGGGLGDGPRFGSDLDIFVRREEVVEICRAIAQVFGELGNRENRGISRMRYLVEHLGPDQFLSEIRARTSLGLPPPLKRLTTSYRGDHVGIHLQKDGKYYCCASVLVGRLTAEDLLEIAEFSERFGSGEIRLSAGQNFLIPNIDPRDLNELESSTLLQKFPVNPNPFGRKAVACTGNEFCRFAVVETKETLARLSTALDKKFGARFKKLNIEPISIHFSGCPASCAQPQIADIALRGDTAYYNDTLSEACDIGVGGQLGPNPTFAKWAMGACPTPELETAITRLVDRFLIEREDGETFHSWSKKLHLDEIKLTANPSEEY